MGVILGVIGVLGSVLIGFMGPGGPVEVLFQPYEFLTIAVLSVRLKGVASPRPSTRTSSA